MSGSSPEVPGSSADESIRLLEGEYLEKAADPEQAAQIEVDLDEKLDALASRKGERFARLRELAGQARGLWAERARLERKHMIYLGAALLYFISPLDAVPDVLPMLGYLDDVAVLSAVITMLAGAVGKVREQATGAKAQVVEEVTDKLVSKGRVALNEIVDERAEELFGRFDRSAEQAVDNSVTTLVVSLWGMTTAAAISLGLAASLGGFTAAWGAYVLLATGLVCVWNLAMAIDYLRGYQALDGAWQQRLRRLVAAKLARRHLLAIGLPVLVLLTLGLVRVFL